MSYQALYRVWRPRTFTDLVGQTHITRTLQNAISQDKFSHAYLFSGPRGTGKTSAAKIFAQTINCEKRPTRNPCNECDACLGILDGSISDVIEIDAASNTGVDDIREIRDKVKYAPSSVPYKIYIIDEVHMITVNAFNALLKTLEEPPAHVVFILATTEPHKIPLTIISRCQRFDFKPISNQVIVDRMKYITEQEGASVSNDALEAIALASEGGMRDALSTLDQAISYSDETVKLSDVLAVTGGVSQDVLTDIIKAMYEQDAIASLTLLDQLIQHGKDPGRFLYDLIYFLRDVLLYKTAPSLEDILESAMVTDRFKELSEIITIDWVQKAIVELNVCQQEIKWTNSPKVFIEITLLTISNGPEEAAGSAVKSDTVIALENRLISLESKLKEMKSAPQATQAPTKSQTRRTAPRTSSNSYKIPYERIRPVLDNAVKSALQHVNSEWANFLNQLKSISPPAHATILDSKPAAASDAAVVVAFRYDIHCSLFLDNQDTVESVLATVMGKPLNIIPIPEQNWQTLRTDFINKQEEKTTQEPEQGDEKDPFIEEARKLVGNDLLEIHD